MLPMPTVFDWGWLLARGLPRGSALKNPPAVQEVQVQTLSWKDPLEKEMAAHSSILAWEISWTEESGRLWSVDSQRVRHDLATKTTRNSSQAIRLRFIHTHTHTHTHTHSYAYISHIHIPVYIALVPICPWNTWTSGYLDLVLYNVAKSEFKSHWLINIHGRHTGNVCWMKKFINLL